MADCGKNILLAREGRDQNSRFIQALDPGSVELNSFNLEDWMEFAYNFAGHINFFDPQNDGLPDGNWQTFFKSKTEIQDFLNTLEPGGDINPHLALFVAFIKLLDSTKQRFNALTQRHLDFYYGQVLQLQKQAASPDTVHVLFELAKNALNEKIEEGAVLDAGKDSTGKTLLYKTVNELVANQAQVAALKSVYLDQTNQQFKAAEIANSYDGKGADFPDDEVKWWPFGYYETPPHTGETDLREYPELDNANIGFALAGEILALHEGERQLAIVLEFEKALDNEYLPNEISAAFEIYCSGADGWLGPLEIIETAEDSEFSFSSGADLNNAHKLNLVFRIPKYEKALVAYDAKIHGEHFDTVLPLCRVLLKTGRPEAYRLYADCLAKKLVQVSIHVDVQGIEELTLSNDVGAINADKPFYPFGTQPVKKSKFYIEYPELQKKKWNAQSLTIEWKNTPDNFKNWYYAYRSNENALFSQQEYIQGIYTETLDNLTAESLQARKILGLQEQSSSGLSESASAAARQINLEANNFIVSGDDYFTAAVEVKQSETWNVASHLSKKVLFERVEDGIFYTDLSVTNPLTGQRNVGPLRLSLNQTFLHELYPRLYALAMSSADETIIVPNEPYTPFIEKLTLGYSASATLMPQNSGYSVNDFKLYHEHPFGQALECIVEKSANPAISAQEAASLYAVPGYFTGGELYVGLANAQPKQNVSLLIQVLEGSENPETETFTEDQGVAWSILCNNAWKLLGRSEIVRDETDNFLKSGILKISLPAEATSNNTLLPSGHMWLKARMPKQYDAVSKILGIHAQAVPAQFSDNANDLGHLAEGLPAETISKMQTRPARVKSVLQPWSSFGGKAEESDAAYYRRISERLRHKNRAINLWDYEHLVLQQFPEVHKVKCLNHTSIEMVNGKQSSNYLAPGNLVLVVIPDIINRNVFDIYKPRMSKASLNEIQAFIEERKASQVKCNVINPRYEEVRVDLKVQFLSGFDKTYYKTVLATDITRLLSPWAFDNQAAIRFGVSLHKSVVVDYVEKLDYVDFVSDVKLFQTDAAGNETNVAVAGPSSPEAILVSAKSHNINDIQTTCPNENANNYGSSE